MVKTSLNDRNQTTPERSVDKTKQFKGVRMRKWGKWVSEVRMPNSRGRIWLGSYDTPQQPARAYDFAVFSLRGRGSNAKFNFPEFLQDLPSPASLSPAEIQAAAARFAAEDSRQPSEDGSAFSGSESRSCINGQQILEEQDWELLLDSLLQDLESSESPNLEGFPALEDLYFPLIEEEQRGGFQRQDSGLTSEWESI